MARIWSHDHTVWDEDPDEIRGLVIGNPDGFESDHAFSLDRIGLVIDTGSITSDVIRIKQVLVEGVLSGRQLSVIAMTCEPLVYDF